VVSTYSTASSVAHGLSATGKKAHAEDALNKSQTHRKSSNRNDDSSRSIQTSTLSTQLQTSPLTRPGQRISLSPFPAANDAPLPEFNGTDDQKLRACMEALKSSHEGDRPTFSNDGNSKFTANLRAVSGFLLAAIESHGEHGGNPGEPAALFVCGAPGVGKTSGVKWCCENAVKSWGSSEPIPAICHINAGHLLTQPKPFNGVMREIGTSLGFKTKTPKLRTIESKLKRNEDDPKGAFLVMVVDEVDALVSSSASDVESGSDGRENCLRTLLDWASDSEKQMAFIGISNCANDEKTTRIHELGKVIFFVDCYVLSFK